MIQTATVADLFTRWDIPWIPTSALIVSSLIYARGWARIRRTRPEIFTGWRLGAFLGGMLAIFIAVASPLDYFADRLLSIHMVQHFFLWSVAPIPIVFSAPVVPMLRGLPRWLIRRGLRLLFSSGVPHRIGTFLTRRRVALLAWTLAFVIWHVPKMFSLALSNEFIHEYGEHLSFFLGSLIFWWPVIAPWPFRQPRNFSSGDSHRWMLIPYLLLASVLNTAVSAFLCFSGRVLYPGNELGTRLLGLTPLSDQIAAGAFMWVSGSMMFLIAGSIVIMQLLSPPRFAARTPPYLTQGQSSLL
ncbi:MAG: cytochrome c oxidase assembly protein [Terracidiphilus sp.]